MASIELEIKFVDFNQEKEHNIPVHYIPAAVDDNVPMTNIDEFFNNYTHEENGGLSHLFLQLDSQPTILILKYCFCGVSFEEFVAWLSTRWMPHEIAGAVSRHCVDGNPTSNG